MMRPLNPPPPLRRTTKTWSLGLAGLLALACGGEAVDLGQRNEGGGFVDAPSAVAFANPTEPQTLCEGCNLLGFTAEDTALYAFVNPVGQDLVELVSCPLDACQSEQTRLSAFH